MAPKREAVHKAGGLAGGQVGMEDRPQRLHALVGRHTAPPARLIAASCSVWVS